MATRYRWFRLQLPQGGKALRDALGLLRFRSDSGEGFLPLDDSAASGSNFRFLWRTQVPVVAVDDAGKTSTQLIAGVDYSDFGISRLDSVDFLRIENPSRSVRQLLNALENAMGMGFTAEPVTFSKGRPTSLFSSVSSSKLVGLKVIGAVAGEGVVARMEFVSKEGMDPQKLRALAGTQYRVESALYEILFDGLRGQVSFSANGLVRVSAHLNAKLVSLIESDLPKLSS